MIKVDPNNQGTLIVSLSANPKHAQKKAEVVLQRSLSFEGQQVKQPRQERFGSFQDQNKSTIPYSRENWNDSMGKFNQQTGEMRMQAGQGMPFDQRPVTMNGIAGSFEGPPFQPQRLFSTGLPIQQRNHPYPLPQQPFSQNTLEHQSGVRQNQLPRQQQIHPPQAHQNLGMQSVPLHHHHLMMPVPPPQPQYQIANGQPTTFINQVQNQNFMKKPINGFHNPQQTLAGGIYQSGLHRQGPIQVRHDIHPLIGRGDQFKEYSASQFAEDPDQKLYQPFQQPFIQPQTQIQIHPEIAPVQKFDQGHAAMRHQMHNPPLYAEPLVPYDHPRGIQLESAQLICSLTRL
ncbi:hypothetical protein FGO68_gene9622 [Halteria grandinella]|uniref:Uncharacterized protein n=1 Tax=Halteria grandinella TaxID=5974 RepID=A0A8J8P3J0_HALGN|nr:hypothetical protein FGO68_gene9622 [Halteria grandinella]